MIIPGAAESIFPGMVDKAGLHGIFVNILQLLNREGGAETFLGLVFLPPELLVKITAV